MNSLRTLVIAACILYPLPGWSDTPIKGEAMLNPFFENGGITSYSNWSFYGNFRDDGGASRVVFDLLPNSGNPVGYSGAVGQGKTGAAIAAENSLDSATYYLAGFDLSQTQPYYSQLGPYGGTPGGSYEFYVELTLSTAQGSFRALSGLIDYTTLTPGGVSLSFSWLDQTKGFLGSPSTQNDGLGIRLSDLTGITMSMIGKTITTNTTSAQTFPTFDNMALVYEVVPEPSSGSLMVLAVLAGVMIIIRTRRLVAAGKS